VGWEVHLDSFLHRSFCTGPLSTGQDLCTGPEGCTLYSLCTGIRAPAPEEYLAPASLVHLDEELCTWWVGRCGWWESSCTGPRIAQESPLCKEGGPFGAPFLYPLVRPWRASGSHIWCGLGVGGQEVRPHGAFMVRAKNRIGAGLPSGRCGISFFFVRAHDGAGILLHQKKLVRADISLFLCEGADMGAL